MIKGLNPQASQLSAQSSQRKPLNPAIAYSYDLLAIRYSVFIVGIMLHWGCKSVESDMSKMQAQPRLKLIGFKICPFVERVDIVLKLKQIECERIEVNIRNKPEWFIRLVPTGKVPALIVDEDQVIFESGVICELLDELCLPSLHPEDPIQKAVNRAWIEWCHSLMVEAYFMSLAPTKEEMFERGKQVEEKLALLEAAIQLPYFNGEKLSMVDVTFAPVLQRFATLSRLFGLDCLAGFSRLQQWSTKLLALPAVQAVFHADFERNLLELLTLKGSCLVTA